MKQYNVRLSQEEIAALLLRAAPLLKNVPQSQRKPGNAIRVLLGLPVAGHGGIRAGGCEKGNQWGAKKGRKDKPEPPKEVK